MSRVKRILRVVRINIGLTLIGLAAVGGAVELIERTRASDRSDAIDARYRRINGESGDELSLRHVAILRSLNSKGTVEYRDYHLMTPGTYESETINFGRYGGGSDIISRFVPYNATVTDPRPLRVWFFGGSTMQNLEVPDERTIANAAIAYLNRSGVPATGLNFGVGGFHLALEVVKFVDLIRRSDPQSWPDLVVFYDGYNDWASALVQGAGNIGEDYRSRMRATIEQDYIALFGYATSQFLARYLKAWEKYAHSAISNWFIGRNQASRGKGSTDAAVRSYVANTQIVAAVGKALGIKVEFVLQPMLLSKVPLSPFETEFMSRVGPAEADAFQRFYGGVRLAMAGASFHDLSSVLNGRQESDFYDYGHIGPHTGSIIGEAIGRSVLTAAGERKRQLQSEGATSR
jgi:hypothetical protein